jgi:CheY-like chemotaxis protein
MLVETMGYEVQLAHDGLSALKIAEQFHPDVVLLDIGMPHLDGYGTVRRIVTRPWAAKTLLIALTGWGQEADRRKAREAGFHRHLVSRLILSCSRKYSPLREWMDDWPAPESQEPTT